MYGTRVALTNARLYFCSGNSRTQAGNVTKNVEIGGYRHRWGWHAPAPVQALLKVPVTAPAGWREAGQYQHILKVPVTDIGLGLRKVDRYWNWHRHFFKYLRGPFKSEPAPLLLKVFLTGFVGEM